MQWLKSAMVVSSVLVVAAAFSVEGCSSNPGKADGGDSGITPTDGSKPKPDGSNGGDSGGCASGLACEVCDVTGYQPTAMAKPVQKVGACTTAQLQAFVTACFSQGASQASCTAWSKTDAGACTTCLAPVNATAAAWGPFFCPTSTSCPANAGGCVDIVTKTTSAEKANNGAGSCGDLVTDNFGCQDYACGGCSTTDFTTCDQSATANECKPKVDQVESTTGPCAPINSDAAPPAVNACFPQDDAGNLDFVDVFCGTGTGTPA